MRLLVVEDDEVLADGITHSLGEAGYAVDQVSSGTEATHILATQFYDLVILDIGLPGMDGFTVLERLRNQRVVTPVIILTARDSLSDRVHGLDLGADDYMLKPFDMPELEARIRALIRRASGSATPDLVVGPLVLDISGHQILLDGVPLELSRREYGVLETLMLRANRVVSKEQLIESLYDQGEEASGNAIEVYIHRIRQKLGNANLQIRTVHGLGYLLEADSHA